MRNLSATAVLACGLGLVAGGASAQSWGRSAAPPRGACFYEDVGFRGRYFCVPVGATTEQVPEGTNDQISSIRVFGSAEVTVFRDRGFRGSSKTFDGNVGDLREEGLNDRISSYRVDSQGYGRNVRAGDWGNEWGRPQVPQAGACFYQNPNFGGDYFCSRVGATVAQVPAGTNDRISSIRLFGNIEVTVYRDSDYRGESRGFDGDLRDLRRLGWNDRISSYRIEPVRFGRGRGRGRSDEGSRSGGASQSGEGVTRQRAEAIVARAYRAVFNRDPDPAARAWVDEVMKNDWTEQQLMRELRQSDEYRNSQRPSGR